MSNTFDCGKCGAGLSAAGAVNGFAKCEYCGAETRVTPPPVGGPHSGPPPQGGPPPPGIMPNATVSSGGSGGSKILIIGILVSLLMAGAGVAVFFASKGVRQHRGAVTWSTSAGRYRGQAGKRYTFRCPANGRARTVWGSGPYTDDSSVCTAAVHAGLITLGSGGRVTVEMVAGQGSYAASERNGVRASSFGTFPGSFVFPAAPSVRRGSGTPGARRSIRASRPSRASWSTSPSAHRGQNGQRFVYLCPPKGRAGNLWGSNPYTGDSSVCTAGAHAGVITFKKGGRVEIEIAAGRSGYPASRRHGVSARAWNAYPSSFKVLGGPPAQPLHLPTPP